MLVVLQIFYLFKKKFYVKRILHEHQYLINIGTSCRIFPLLSKFYLRIQDFSPLTDREVIMLHVKTKQNTYVKFYGADQPVPKSLVGGDGNCRCIFFHLSVPFRLQRAAWCRPIWVENKNPRWDLCYFSFSVWEIPFYRWHFFYYYYLVKR